MVTGTYYPFDPGKNDGKPEMCVGNPVNPATGNKYQVEIDYAGAPGKNAVKWERHYNSSKSAPGSELGPNWRHSYSRSIYNDGAVNTSAVQVYRPDGKAFFFSWVDGSWKADADINDSLQRLFDASNNPAGWSYTVAADDSVEIYNVKGQLISITNREGLVQTLTYSDATTPTSIAPKPDLLIAVKDAYNRQLSLTYDAQGRIATLKDPAGELIQYSYDSANNLATVTYQDNKVRTYHYNEPLYTAGTDLPHALTGITGENNWRYATYQYDAQGRAVSSEHAGGAGKVSLVYNLNGTTTVTDALSTARTYNFQTILGVLKNTSLTQPCTSCGGDTSAKTYDANGNVLSRTDFNGNLTCYAYDLSRNLETVRVEGFAAGSVCPADLAAYTPAANTAQRKISTEWHPTWRVINRRVEPKRLSTFVWGDTAAQCGATGVACSKRIQATTDNNGGLGFAASTTGTSRAWTYTYNSRGQILSANGPRTDVSDIAKYSYYANNDATVNNRKQLKTVTDALGHTTTYSNYDAHGHALRITDANGVITDLTYDTRNRLTGSTVAGRTTTLQYNSAGLLWKVTPPGQSASVYGYDAAYRLKNITNGAGEKIVYTLDGLGNRTKEQTFVMGSSIAATVVNRKFDALGRLWKLLNAVNAETEVLTYDAQGNLDTRTAKPDGTAANNQLTNYSGYDALNRLTQITDTINGITEYRYDGLDHLTQVKDPRLNATTYSINGLDNQTQEISPDRGTLKNTVFDVAGNVKTSLDARSNTTQYTYDALNRILSQTYADGTSVTYEYDTGTGAIGKLDRIDDSSGATAYQYDSEGRLIRKEQTTGTLLRGVDYGYDPVSGLLSSITYPSGAIVNYSYDSAGRMQSIAVAGNATAVPTTILSNIAYQPQGPVNSYQLPAVDGAPSISRDYDNDGRVASYTLFENIGGVPTLVAKTLLYDRLGNLKTLGDAGTSANDQSYGYDKLNRLTDFSAPALNTVHGYGYDANGNRETKTVNGVTKTNTYAASSNRIATINGVSYMHDASGNITDNGTQSFSYDAKGRLAGTSKAGVSYTYGINGLGQRVAKTSTALTTGGRVYVYDEAGHLLGEYTATGGRIQEHVWLGDQPVAVINGGGTVFYVLSDQLNTPRQIINSAKQLRWRWDNNDPFGGNAPNQNPQGLGGFGYNLRFPGQYFDAESGLFYNYFRDYDPRLGRYGESDPIGLRGGLNSYAYVKDNPLLSIDPFGLLDNDLGIDFPNDFTPCFYYNYRCAETGCFYYCNTAKFMCNNSQYNPLFVGVTNNQFNCIRSCLVREDNKQHQKRKECTENNCLSDETIDNYHEVCFTECGVPAWRYPQVYPFNPKNR